ncbi:MAG: LPS export ABC transporter periplasmic protein LptC [Bacteroidales bacterium]|nr:LPS export ABC transporter periplasmic protein LptC [Bacteroidales bacterium]
MVASVAVSCRGKLGSEDLGSMDSVPFQTVDDMFAVRTKNGFVDMRMEAPLMQRFETDTNSFESFPKGFAVYGYTQEGLLETVIVSDDARHITSKKGKKEESWQAFGNVVIHNVLKIETMETDTIYWDQSKQEIYTDCYVKMYSPDGFMQGYGMRSDDHARNAILHRPFNTYGVVEQDSTKVAIDSVNFIGPFLLKN